MTIEDRVTAALRVEARGIEPGDGAWRAVQTEVRRRRRRRRTATGGALAAAAAVAAFGVVTFDDDDPTSVAVGSGDDAETTDTTDTTVVQADEPAMGAFWPFSSMDEVEAYVDDPGVGMFFDGEATALEFAREYLGMPDPVAPEGFQPAEGFSGYVEVRPRPSSPVATTVWVHRYGGDEGAYAVYFAETANIQPDTEALAGPHGTTIPLTGRSTAYEAHVDVEVRDTTGRVLGRTSVMGGANGEMAPFSGEIEIDSPSTETGVVVFSTSSAEDGTVQEAAAVRVRFRSDAIVTGTREYSVFFHRGEELVEVRRSGPATQGVLQQALESLVAGPRPEDGAGLSSFFSSETADIIAGVNVRDGLAIVDLAHEPPGNAGTAAGGAMFGDQLDATVFQFPTVERIEYRLRGSCEDFWYFFGGAGCEVVERADWQQESIDNR